MKKFFKWVGFVVAGLVGIALIGVAWIYLKSEGELHRHYAIATLPAPPMPTAAADIAEGKRLAHLAGCTHCHGENLTGGVPLDIPNVVRFVAPNLTQALPKYSDAQLITLLRKGVKPDGTSVYFMPSEMFQHLRDADLARIMAWVRTVPAAAGITGHTDVHLIGRVIIATDQYKSSARYVEEFPDDGKTIDFSDPRSHGKYLAISLCSECHGPDLNGSEDAKAPSLVVAKGYSEEDFAKLMHEGVALGGRQLELMSPTARARFASFTPEEVAVVYAFLKARPD